MRPIINWNSENTESFSQLETGDVFSCGGDLYMKIRAVKDDAGAMLWNSVSLATGVLVWHTASTAVKSVNIEINVKEN